MNAREGQVGAMPGHMWDIDMAHMKTRVGKMTGHMKDKGRAQMKACIKIWGKDVEHVMKRVGHMPWLRQGRDRYEGKSRASGATAGNLWNGSRVHMKASVAILRHMCDKGRTHVARAGHI